MLVSYYLDQDFEFSELRLPNRETQNRWSGVIRADRIPMTATFPLEITAWAVDLQKNRVYRHGETFVIGRNARDPSEAVAAVEDAPEN
jgi:hypothetical protein